MSRMGIVATEEEAAELFALVDVDRDGRISVAEFARYIGGGCWMLWWMTYCRIKLPNIIVQIAEMGDRTPTCAGHLEHLNCSNSVDGIICQMKIGSFKMYLKPTLSQSLEAKYCECPFSWTLCEGTLHLWEPHVCQRSYPLCRMIELKIVTN